MFSEKELEQVLYFKIDEILNNVSLKNTTLVSLNGLVGFKFIKNGIGSLKRQHLNVVFSPTELDM